MRQGTPMKDIPVADCGEEDGRLYYRERQYVPENLECQVPLIQEHHDTALAGHPGRAETFDILR
jgi:hypothetical protein